MFLPVSRLLHTGLCATHSIIAQLHEDALHRFLQLLTLILHGQHIPGRARTGSTHPALARLVEQVLQFGIAELHVAAPRLDRLEQVLRC